MSAVAACAEEDGSSSGYPKLIASEPWSSLSSAGVFTITDGADVKEPLVLGAAGLFAEDAGVEATFGPSFGPEETVGFSIGRGGGLSATFLSLGGTFSSLVTLWVVL